MGLVPTTLPWGIKIDAAHRLEPFQNLGLYPVDTTRFHPTFAYEMILNILLGLLLLWITLRYSEKIKPGTIFGGWLVAAGLARVFVEFFRPDQPRLGGTFVTSSMLVAFLMAVAGVLFLLVRYGKWQLAFAQGWVQEYHIKPVEEKPYVHPRAVAQASPEEDDEFGDDRKEEEPAKPVKRKPAVRKTAKKRE